MASIASLLNPAPNLIRSDHYPLPTPSPTNSTSTVVMLRSPRQKKQKMAKDAPIFQRGKPRGDVNYPPQEVRSFVSELLEFSVHPFGNIADYPRHIPYNSDKKSFQERTGRESFEVFQYTFQLPGEDAKWTVMWDYNIGLVRTTSLFKCNEYSKTTPAKMLNQNPGLRDICHSITGGALAAQGYWMPYEAAKAVASTFCWKIRYALTPLFGEDFPDSCIRPDDRTRFGRMVIDPSVVQLATRKSNEYRILELRNAPLKSLRPDYNDYRPSSAPGGDWDKERDRLALGRHILPKHHRSNTMTSTDTSLLGYGSSPEIEYYSSHTEPYCISPVSPNRTAFTPVNVPRSTDVYPPSSNYLPSPHEVLASLSSSASTTSTSTSRPRSKAKIRALARARAGARGRMTPSSIPPDSASTTSSTTALPTRSTNTSFPSSALISPIDGSDMDADAETDPEYDLDFETGSSDTSSNSSTASSGSSLNVGLAATGLPSYRDSNTRGMNVDAGVGTPDSRCSTRTLATSRKRQRGAHQYPSYNDQECDRQQELAHGYTDARPSARTHAPSHPHGHPQVHGQSYSDSRLMCEMTAAHALISLMQETVTSNAVPAPGANARGDKRMRIKQERDESKHAIQYAEQSRSRGAETENNDTGYELKVPVSSGLKRRRASA